MRRHSVFTHATAVLAGVVLTAAVTAEAGPSRSAAPSNLTARVHKLELDDIAVKSTVANICVFLHHVPQVQYDTNLTAWLQQIGLGCNTFGLH